MMTLPLVLRGDVRPFVIVGGGPVAARKADTLVKAGAEVLLIAPQVTADIQSLADDGALTLALREAQSGEVFRAGSFVVLATNDADKHKRRNKE